MPRPEEGGEHRRRAFLRHTFNSVFRLLWNLVTGLGRLTASVHIGAIFIAAPRANPAFPGKCCHFFDPNIRQLRVPGGGVMLSQMSFAVLRSAINRRVRTMN